MRSSPRDHLGRSSACAGRRVDPLGRIEAESARVSPETFARSDQIPWRPARSFRSPRRTFERVNVSTLTVVKPSGANSVRSGRNATEQRWRPDRPGRWSSSAPRVEHAGATAADVVPARSAFTATLMSKPTYPGNLHNPPLKPDVPLT
jgi:hypothetical protein